MQITFQLCYCRRIVPTHNIASESLLIEKKKKISPLKLYIHSTNNFPSKQNKPSRPRTTPRIPSQSIQKIPPTTLTPLFSPWRQKPPSSRLASRQISAISSLSRCSAESRKSTRARDYGYTTRRRRTQTYGFFAAGSRGGRGNRSSVSPTSGRRRRHVYTCGSVFRRAAALASRIHPHFRANSSSVSPAPTYVGCPRVCMRGTYGG